MRTYEKKRDVGSLHGHALLYVPKEHMGIVERIADLFEPFDKKRSREASTVEIHAEVIGKTQDDLRNAILYALKEHKWAGPGHDGAGSRRKFYEKGAPIKGRRISFSKGAKEVLSFYQASLPKSELGAIFAGQKYLPDNLNDTINEVPLHAKKHLVNMNLLVNMVGVSLSSKENTSTKENSIHITTDDRQAMDIV